MCPVCDGDRFTTVLMAGLTLRRCRSCGLWLSDFAAERGTSYADIDPSDYLQSIGSVRRAQSEAIVAFVREHVSSGDWLDVGCGFGFVLEAAQAAGYAARGIEPNPVAVTAARQRAANVEQGVLDDATPAADVLSTLDVLEHLQDIEAFAELVKRKVRGLWVIKVPSSDGLFFRVAHAFRIKAAIHRLWQSNYEDPHRVYFNEATLGRFLERRGFTVVASHYLQEVPTATVVERLTLDAAIPRWKARLAVPVFWLINLVERFRSRSDALVMIARRRTS